MQLGNTDGCSLPHIRVLILETLAQGLTQVLSDLVHSDAAHRADRQGSDQRVGVLTVLVIMIQLFNFYLCMFNDQKLKTNNS